MWAWQFGRQTAHHNTRSNFLWPPAGADDLPPNAAGGVYLHRVEPDAPERSSFKYRLEGFDAIGWNGHGAFGRLCETSDVPLSVRVKAATMMESGRVGRRTLSHRGAVLANLVVLTLAGCFPPGLWAPECGSFPFATAAQLERLEQCARPSKGAHAHRPGCNDEIGGKLAAFRS